MLSDADTLKAEVTGASNNGPLTDPIIPKMPAAEPAEKEENGKDSSMKNLAFILLAVFFLGALALAGLYLLGFLNPSQETGIDYELASYLPDEDLQSAGYVTLKEEAFKDLSSILGEMLGGSILKDFKKAEVAFGTYEGSRTGVVFYVESSGGVEDLLKKVQDYAKGNALLSSQKPEIQKKSIGGRDYYIITNGLLSTTPVCAWQQGSGVVFMAITRGYGYGAAESAQGKDCASALGEKHPTKKFQDVLAGAEEIRQKIGSQGKAYAQAWIWNKGTSPMINTAYSDISATLNQSEPDKSIYGYAYSDQGGIYIVAAGQNLAAASNQQSGFCAQGTVVRSGGKEACLKDTSGISLMPTMSLISFERGAGKYSIYVIGYQRKADKEAVKKTAESLVFSVNVEGAEKRWKDKKFLTVSVKDEDTLQPIDNARVLLQSSSMLSYSSGRDTLAEKYTDSSGKAEFKDLPVESYLTVEVSKEGYDNGTGYVSTDQTTEDVLLGKPKCGDYRCSGTENCGNCPSDCRCGLYEECSAGVCVQKKQVSSYIYEEPRSYYSIDLPDVKGGVWNISYTSRSERIYITAPKCFYLSVLSPGGEIYPYKAEDSAGRNITVCTSANGGQYNLTGPRIAAWFNWNGCARTKYYDVVKNQEITLHVYTDNCADCMCTYPNFDIYEQVQGNWNKYEPTNKSAVDDCANMSSADSRKECLYHLAMRRVDSSLCEQLANDGGKWSRDECIRHVAIKDLNYPTCLEINRTASKEWCISTIAYILEDPSVCAQMNTQPDKDVCYRSVAYEKNDPSICDKMEIDDQRDWCYYHLAYRLKQQAVCEKIKGSDVLNLCRGDVSGDPSFCGKIGLENLKEMCMEHNSIINKPEEPVKSSAKAGPYCGDGLCTLGEDRENCSTDCAVDYDCNAVTSATNTWCHYKGVNITGVTVVSM